MVKNITSTQYEYRCLNLEFIFMIISTVQKHTFPINCCRVQSSPIFWQIVVPTNLSDNPWISTKIHCHCLATNPTQPNVIYVCRFWCYRFICFSTLFRFLPGTCRPNPAGGLPALPTATWELPKPIGFFFNLIYKSVAEILSNSEENS